MPLKLPVTISFRRSGFKSSMTFFGAMIPTEPGSPLANSMISRRNLAASATRSSLRGAPLASSPVIDCVENAFRLTWMTSALRAILMLVACTFRCQTCSKIIGSAEASRIMMKARLGTTGGRRRLTLSRDVPSLRGMHVTW